METYGAVDAWQVRGSAAVSGDSKADVFTTTATAGTATLTLSPFLSGSGIPAGSVLASAKLRVVYPIATYQPYGFEAGYLNQPRMWGVRVKYRFGE